MGLEASTQYRQRGLRSGNIAWLNIFLTNFVFVNRRSDVMSPVDVVELAKVYQDKTSKDCYTKESLLRYIAVLEDRIALPGKVHIIMTYRVSQKKVGLAIAAVFPSFLIKYLV